jgi:hypothetical protein
VGDPGRHRPRPRARTITLNHDAGRWLSLGLPGDLPAVVREVNGQWQRHRPRRPRGTGPRLCACASFALAGVPPPAYQLAAQQAGARRCCTRWRCRRAAPAARAPDPLAVDAQRRRRAERYATRAEACAGIRRALARTPANRIDAGLGQVNLGYHAHRYDHPCELLDPYRNLAIAAEILQEQHTPGEDWLAIGRYHRPAGGRPPPATAAASTST